LLICRNLQTGAAPFFAASPPPFLACEAGPHAGCEDSPRRQRRVYYATLRGMRQSPQPPRWIKPQLTRAADEAPAGPDWLHEVKYDGYRMHARLVERKAQLLTRTCQDWSVAASSIRLPMPVAPVPTENLIMGCRRFDGSDRRPMCSP
jgi:hypothetical protein